jgi:predicted enzyme related to lactoylglutathione lyase
LRLDAVLINTQRLDELTDFYRRALDLPEPRPFGETHLGFTLDNSYLGVQRGDGAIEIWFRVDDVDAAYERLLTAGATPSLAPTRDESPGEAVALALDPDGNAIGLVGPP